MKYALSLSFLFALATASIAKEDEQDVYITPDAAPASFQLQGEYQGQAGDKGRTYAAQIIALGNNRFHLVAYQGGLPGDDQSHKNIFFKADGELDGDAVTFAHEDFLIAVSGGQLHVTNASGKKIVRIDRIVRKSPTLGAQPPEGALVLFDGSNGDAFEGAQVDEGLLLADTFSKQKFGDHTMHLEFRTPYKPSGRGQGRGNSGVYVQSRYEIQVLDSFGLAGKSNECGGIYKIAEPRVNMCLPPLQWQTYDIDFTAARYDDEGNKTANARVTVKHNGVVIHDDLELPQHTPGRHQEGPGPDSLYLQGHGNPVYYRNIWVVKK
ncbi:hypothetical protein Mal15_63410 [Stieleria maiorica]|uniref:3-keto-alpha-glucoside-1,2-lyase/3-keto-2-hydroxy-glucal hydratase domain-containing protein n=1 Tax=Stieleria maiorica TaxID=2795974 RepID=A0A5B9MQW7_9BACT|nr:DUF1080 domain-containing protein [Stieleria maiorica]QEG02255.1 hypothetical protein Mal15_63410 [Stieleria maiorica]